MIELLAPAGTWEALKAAVAAGANAVYLGGKMFGARQYAANFDNEELAEAIKFAHIYGVQVYVAVNTLVDDSEIPLLITYLIELYEQGADAIIVQDLGVAEIAKKVIPELPLHASTQMTVHNLAGVQFLVEKGFKRVVLARELSLTDISYICQNSPIEIETFIHGALCISYSGQCLMSSMIGGRSGNRGRCAQPCRLPYQLVDKAGQDVLKNANAGEYLLSPKDLNTIEIIPKFAEAGVTSFKIEGRMKRPEYVAVVVDAYRRAIDLYNNTPYAYEVCAQDHYDLTQIFNRGFSNAYLLGKEGRNMMSDRRPNNRGVQTGRVIRYDYINKTVVLKLEQRLGIGDIIEFWVKVGGRVCVTVNAIEVKGKQVQEAMPGSEAVLAVPASVALNDRVFKTFDAKLTERAQALFAGTSIAKRIIVDVKVEAKVGKPLKIIMQDQEGFCGEGLTEFIGEPPIKHMLTNETLIKQISRLRTSNFVINNIECIIDDAVMVPVSEINNARRLAVENLEKARLSKFQRTPLNLTCRSKASVVTRTSNARKAAMPELVVNVDTPAKANAALISGADIIMFGGERFDGRTNSSDDFRQVLLMSRNAGKKIIFSMPRLAQEGQIPEVLEEVILFNNIKPDAISVGNLGLLQLVKQNCSIPIHADFPLNIYNSAAIAFLLKCGVTSTTLSPELNFTQIAKLLINTSAEVECLVQGSLTVMLSEYCAVGSFLGNLATENCTKVCQKGSYFLKDRKNEQFPVYTDQYCRMHILNAKELDMAQHIGKFRELGINSIRIEGKQMDSKEIKNNTELYRELLNKNSKTAMSESFSDKITRGHYFRGVQ